MNNISAPKLVAARAAQNLVAVGGGFDIDVLHAMEERDESLIADEIMHGSLTGAFVYDFEIAGKNVTGVSVIGARHLMYHYGSIRHRLVATTMKKGAQFVFTTYPSDFGPMSVNVSSIEEMADDPDFYQVLVELTDKKKGNSLQRERIEMRFERKRDGSYYERPNFQTIAQSKAYRNAVLDLLPQDVVLAFKAEAIKLGKSTDITENVIDVKRRSVIQFAAARGVALDRSAVGQLGWTEISGLSDAARAGQEAFVRSAAGVGILSTRAMDLVDGGTPAPAAPPAPAATRPPAARTTRQIPPKADPPANAAPSQASNAPPPDDAPPASEADHDDSGQGTDGGAANPAANPAATQDRPAPAAATVVRKDLF